MPKSIGKVNKSHLFPEGWTSCRVRWAACRSLRVVVRDVFAERICCLARGALDSQVPAVFLCAKMELVDRRLKIISPEIVYSDGGFLAAGASIVAMLKEMARTSPRRRCRLCFHRGPGSPQQEMLIVMHRDSYVRPHRHSDKVETFTVIEGHCEALLFDEAGRVTETIPMAPFPQGGRFFYRMPPDLFHTLIFRSEWLVYLETTVGPFDPASTEAAAWAPPETEPEAGQAYLLQLSPSQ